MITNILLGVATVTVVFLLVKQVSNKHKQLPGDKNYSPPDPQENQMIE
jgi:hypothetical protein